MFSLQLCLLFFLKTIKLYKGICSAWISSTSAGIFFSQINVLKAICKPRHWNWNWNWTDTTNAIISSSIRFRMLGWGNPTHKITWHFDSVVTWQTKNVISPLSQGLCTLNLAGWWFRMKRPHLQSHVTSTTESRDKSKTFYDHIHKVHDPKKVLGCWIRMKGPHPKSHVTLQFCSHVKNQKRHISSTTALST